MPSPPETQSLAVGLHSLRGEAWEKAVAYLGQAGSEAIARSAYREAAESLEQAISALEHLPEEASRFTRSIDLRLDLARPTLYQLGDVKRAAAVLREAEARALALGDDRRLGRVTAQLVFCLRVMGHKSEAILAGERALDIARRLSDLEIEIPANTGLGQVLYDRGDYRDAAALFRRNIDVLVGGLSLRSFRGGAPRSIHSRTCLASSLARSASSTRRRAARTRRCPPPMRSSIHTAWSSRRRFRPRVAPAGRLGDGPSTSSSPRSPSRGRPMPRCGSRESRPRSARPTSWPVDPATPTSCSRRPSRERSRASSCTSGR